MAKDQNFENGNEQFNIHLDPSGNLYFKANNKNGDGDTRMIIADDSRQVTIVGQLQLQSSTGANTLFLGTTGTEATALLGSGAGYSGHVQLFDRSGVVTADLRGDTGTLVLGSLDGSDGVLEIRSLSGTTGITLSGSSGNIEATSITLSAGNDIDEPAKVQLGNADGLTTVDIQGSAGNITLGAYPSGSTPGKDGNLFIRDGIGELSIFLSGLTGDVTARSFTARSFTIISHEDFMEITSGEKNGIAPIPNALNKVLGLRAVRYHWKQEDSLQQGCSKDSHIGFIGQEVETVCPEVVSTNSEGYKFLHYSSLTAVLVEAMKEQQSLIKQQAAALSEALGKIERLEVTMQQLQA